MADASAMSPVEEFLDDEDFDSEDEDFGSKCSDLLSSNQFDEILRTGETNIEVNESGMDDNSEEKSTSYRSELKNIFNILTRQDTDDSAYGPSDELRNNFNDYKKHMDDITPSKDGGVMKKILRPGNGTAAGLGTKVKYHYMLQIEDQDDPFDSSFVRGRLQKTKLGDGTLISGLELALTTMKEGEIADFILDSEYAFGTLGIPPRIPRSCTIRATVRMYECMQEDAVDAMTLVDRRKLNAKEAMAYIHRKLEDGKKHFNRGKYVAAINRYKDAVTQAEFATTNWTDEEKNTVKEFACRLYKNLAVCLVKLSMLNKAEKYLKKLDECIPRDAKARFLWAKICKHQGEYEMALGELRLARALQPTNPEILKLMKEVEKEKGDYAAKSTEQAKRMLSVESVEAGGDGKRD